jgi:putative spermidine/putrescine transport system permease protein
VKRLRALPPLLAGALLALPLLGLAYLSLVEAWRFPALGGEGLFTLRHWADTARGANGLLRSLGLSLLLSGGVALLAAGAGFALAGRIAAHPRRRALFALAYFPYLVAPVVLGALWQVWWVRLGWSGTLGGVLVAQLLFVLPYGVLFFAGFWNDRLRQLLLQARSLGASPVQAWWRVAWPMGRPWLVAGLFQCFLLSWFEYGLTRLLGVGKVPTLTVSVVRAVQEADPHAAAVAGLLMALPPLLLLAANRSVFFRRPAA